MHEALFLLNIGQGPTRLPIGAKCGKVTVLLSLGPALESGLLQPVGTTLRGKVSRGALPPDQ